MGNLWRVVSPHPRFPALLFHLQSAEFLLSALLAVPELLAVVVHAKTVGPHQVQVFVGPQWELRMLRQPGVPVSRQRRCWLVGAPHLALGPGSSGRCARPASGVMDWVEAVVGDDVDAVSGQDLSVGVIMAGAGVDAGVGELQTLKQQTPLHVEGASITILRERAGGWLLVVAVLHRPLEFGLW